jgi:AcrB/AcrD/AcrF family
MSARLWSSRGFVTTPIERAVSSISGVDYVESTSVAGLSTVTVRLKLNHPSTVALAEVGNRLVQEIAPEATLHGMRSCFRDWAGESTAHPREVIEHALAHGLKDATEASYARGDLLKKRQRLIQDWTDYAMGTKGTVVSISSGRKRA